MAAMSDQLTRLVLLGSEEGRRRLAECAVAAAADQPPSGGAASKAALDACQAGLLAVFTKQQTDYTCSLVSAALVMSAPSAARSLAAAPGQEVDRSKLPYSESVMLSLPETLSVTSPDQLKGGMVLDQLSALLIAHSCAVRTVHAADSSEAQFRTDALSALSHTNSSAAIIVNYSMEVLGQGLPYGHFSPLGAYHARSDTLLVLDVWHGTEECWAPVSDLFLALNTVDSESGLTRGYIVVSV